MNNEQWYKYSNSEVLKQLNSNIKGLSNEVVQNRLLANGKNELPKEKRESFIHMLYKELLDPIVIVLLCSIIFSIIVKEYIDAYAIIFIVVVDLLMGAIQERRALKSAESLAEMINIKTNVIRNGKELYIDSSELVVGDIVEIESGAKITADLRILESTNLTIDESILTGESINVFKNSDRIKEDASINERINMLFAGTSVITGRATCIVVGTGVNTELGLIAEHVNNTLDTKSPLTIRMDTFSKQITKLIVFIALIVTILLFIKGTPGDEIFLSVIALSVSALPEGLPLALTLALTIGSNRMAKKNVIVKKLNSVESLGSCTIIASDKTGTLTENQQTAKMILFPNDDKFEIGGSGYNVDGTVTSSTNSNIESAKRISFFGYINNEANMEYVNDTWVCLGDSIDIAFLALGKKLKLGKRGLKILDSIPYESENKYSALFYSIDNKTYCTIKGSLEVVMKFSNKMRWGDDTKKIDKKKLELQNQKMAGSGYRVIALASGEVISKKKYSESDINDLCFEGMIGFIDPVRKEVSGAIAECKTAGIKVVMITGDHPLTAYTIAHELKLLDSYDELATGKDIDEFDNSDDSEFDDFISSKKVFARVTPMNKLRIVESYKRQGEFVAVTGDGVNDAPALKSANIGIAMGSGTDVAKETAKMIIIDDNFTSIVSGIKEGRNAYNNIRKIIYFLLSCGIAEVLFFILSILFNLPMPLVAVQLLWVNLVTDGLQDMALSFEKVEKDVMTKKPRDPKENLFSKDLFSEVLFSGLVIGGIIFVVWIALLNIFHLETYLARGYILTLMVFIQNMHVLNCRSENKSIFKYKSKNLFVVFSIASAMLLQFIAMEVPILSKFLKTSSIPLKDITILFLISLLVNLVMEIYKLIKNNYKEKL